MVNIKSKNLSVLIVELEGTDPESVLGALEKKLDKKFFSKTGGMPFLIKPKEGTDPALIRKVEEFLLKKGFKPIFNAEGTEKKRAPERSLFETLENLPGSNVLVINRPLRAGQSIEHNGDVVIIGDVNPGAEVKATGNVIVMGALKGVAWAGYPGNYDAVIVAMRMQPAQLRIGNIIAVNEEETRKAPDYAEIARVENGEVVIKRLV